MLGLQVCAATTQSPCTNIFVYRYPEPKWLKVDSPSTRPEFLQPEQPFPHSGALASSLAEGHNGVHRNRLRAKTAANPTVFNINKDFHRQIHFCGSHAVVHALSLSSHLPNSPSQWPGRCGGNQKPQDLQEPGLEKAGGRSAWAG